MGFTCQVVRGSSAFTPCLEHVRAEGGGGGSVANALFHVMKAWVLYFPPSSLCTCTVVQSGICHFRCHRDMRVYMWRT